MRVTGRILGFAAAVLMGTTASAAPLQFSNIGGGWLNQVPVIGVTVVNAGGSAVDSVNWGQDGAGGVQSGYDFDPRDGSFSPVVDTPFLLGTFTHRNQQVNPPILESVDYNLTFSTDGIPAAFNHTFSLAHIETVNEDTQAECDSGPNGEESGGPPFCDDFVQIFNTVAATNIAADGRIYTFTLLGFSQNGGVSSVNTFQSPEFANNQAGLSGIITVTPSQVPEPSTLLLLGGGVLAVVGRQIVRRRAR